MSTKDLRQESRSVWTVTLAPGEKISTENIKLGCLLRIADAADELRRSITQLMAERDRQKARADRLENQNRGLKGHITKLQKKLAEVKGD